MDRLKHGMYRTKVYKRWIYMKSRCNTDPDYIRKGITVCDRWLHDFQAFYADMGEPFEGATLDRIDGAKGYSPDNCRWATYKQQNRNLSSNVWSGNKTVSEIAEETGLSHTAITYRLKQGLDVYAPAMKERTHCKAGHPWTDENTRISKVKRKQGGYREQRYCRVCGKLHQRNRRGVDNKTADNLPRGGNMRNPKRTV